MQCDYFKPTKLNQSCGSCSLGNMNYDEQLNYKLNLISNQFINIYTNPFDIIKSRDGAFRCRAEFRINRLKKNGSDNIISYAMSDMDRNILLIDKCSIVTDKISYVMKLLIEELKINYILHNKLFTVNFLSTSTGDILTVLIYHRKLDKLWEIEAKKLEKKLSSKIIGRSKKQKIILSEDFVHEQLTINNHKYVFLQYEGTFTQPNANVNEKMIEWVLKYIPKDSHAHDLCELYCGNGNFTIPLAKVFRNVLATEISKTSIKSAKKNCLLNNVNNIAFARMSSEEFVQAKNNVREFKRLLQDNITIDNFNFGTIFVDPPRSGLDKSTLKLCSEFDNVIYISCNPITLYYNIKELLHTHNIIKMALFDQFAFTKHIEMGVVFSKK